MDRVFSGIKELYEQVGDYEYNRINPYKKMLKAIRIKYPDAVVTQCKTETIVFGELLVPTLTMRYTTGKPA